MDLIERLREVARIHDRTDFIVSAVCADAADALEAAREDGGGGVMPAAS